MSIFSPQPMKAYDTGTDPSLLEILGMGGELTAAWNLYWLSNPTVDRLLDSSLPWWEAHKVTSIADVVADVAGDALLCRHLRGSPTTFLTWWKAERDHSIFDCYSAYGGETWVQTVTARTVQAINAGKPSNVVPVRFRREALA